MKNKIISLVIAGVLLGGSLGAPSVQAQTLGQQSAWLASISQLTDSFTRLLASVVGILAKQAEEDTQQATMAQKTKEIVETIQAQAEALKKIVNENADIGPVVQQLSKTLRPGDTGVDVEILQEFLAAQPELYPEQLVTGYYGPLTKKAVSKLQEKFGLEPVGVVGPKTLEIINQQLAKEGIFNITIPPSLSLSEYTVVILNIVNELKQVPSAKKQAIAARLAEFARMRKDVVLREMKNNPQAVIDNALPSAAVSQLPPEVLNLIEQRRQIQGRFEYLQSDNFDTGQSVDEFYVTEKTTGKRYQIHFANKDIPEAKTDDLVVISGVQIEADIAAMTSDVQVLTTAALTATVSKKVAVIMFNWQNDTRTTFTESSARDTFFTGSNSANSYYREISFGQLELVGKLRADGDVFGWITIPYDNTNCATMYGTWASAAETQLKASGIDLSGYNIRTYVFPDVSCGGWGGLGSLGGNPSYSWINGTSLGTIIHELGHNLARHHSSSYSCTESGIRVPISANPSNCVLGEYGDRFDVMGLAGEKRHMNNYQKGRGSTYSVASSWLSEANTQTIDSNTQPDGTYTIVPIEQASAGVQSLRIPRIFSSIDAVSEYYYLEFRQPYGFDNFTTTSPVVNGVTIRLAPQYAKLSKSKLIDTTSNTMSFSDASLAVGKTFTDPDKGINITTLSVSPTGAQVRVSFGPLPCLRANPSLTLSPTNVSLYAGQSASFTYTLTNNDATSCPSSDFSVTPLLPAGFTQSPSAISHSLVDGASVSGTFIISAPADVGAGSYSITETAQNMSSPTYQSTASLTMNIFSPDTTPPAVTITSPADGTTVSKGNVTITASASDASGIAEIKILVDGGLIKTCFNTTSCSARVSAGRLTVGTHSITTQATDKGGPVANTASISIAIIKK